MIAGALDGVAALVPRDPAHVFAHAIVWEAHGRYADVEPTSEGVLVGLTDFAAHREVIEVDPRDPDAAARRINAFLSRGAP